MILIATPREAIADRDGVASARGGALGGGSPAADVQHGGGNGLGVVRTEFR